MAKEAKAQAAKGPKGVQRKPAAATRKRPAAAPPEHAPPKEVPAESAESIGDAKPIDPATMSDEEWRKFLNREHSKVYGKQLTQMKKSDLSKEQVLAAAQSAATAWTDELRKKYGRPKIKQRKQ